MTILDMVKDQPSFKRFCARKINGKRNKPKRFRVPIPKPKGALSVLGEYTSGRRIKHYGYACDERLMLKKISGEFVSSYLTDPDAESMTQYAGYTFGDELEPETNYEETNDEQTEQIDSQ